MGAAQRFTQRSPNASRYVAVETGLDLLRQCAYRHHQAARLSDARSLPKAKRRPVAWGQEGSRKTVEFRCQTAAIGPSGRAVLPVRSQRAVSRR